MIAPGTNSVTILGIDPGLRCTGWGVIRAEGSKLTGLGCGVIRPSDKLSLPARLGEIAAGLEALLTDWQPDEAAVEETFANMNASATLKLGFARGVALAIPAKAGLWVGEYSAKLVKQCVTGYGSADKTQMTGMIARLLPGLTIERHDAADALAVALTHAMLRQSRLRLAAAGVASH